jgi:hypothetical protein
MAFFYSREYATDTTKRPKLYVDWTVIAVSAVINAAVGI